MAVQRIRNHGRWVWQARVAHRGLRRSAFRESRDAARAAQAELLRELKAEAAQAEQAAARPATLRQLLEYYALDMAARGKGEESVGRVDYTRRSIEALLPELLEKPVGAIADADLFAYRNRRAREGSTVYQVVAGKRVKVRVPTAHSTINRDLRTLRAALKKARPDYRFPGGAFFPEDETRVRWLRPEEELLVLEPMPSPFREMAKLAALTLMRQGEIRRLRCAVGSWGGRRLLGWPASESGILCRGDGTHGRGDRRRRMLMLATLRTIPASARTVKAPRLNPKRNRRSPGSYWRIR